MRNGFVVLLVRKTL